MLYQIATFLLDLVGGLLTGACLLRFYMQWQRVSFANPLGRVVMALSDWLVLPLRRVLRAVRGWDVASLVAALLLQLAQYGLLWLLMGAGVAWVWLLWLALFGLLRVAITGLMGLLLVFAVLSWMPARAPLADVIARLCAPLLRPLQRILPPLGGVDWSALVALVLLQIALIVLGHVQASVLMG
ncbi:YggT family protein [Extensimonas perlucida]|jgi:Predicted integral membrane protein|uniref:YggT family protein n=1 Tax=Extensimonas perlucida TaxID=2590786 RepID=UPI0011A87555|nr:YggT family protein [Extensimonas perlucida]